MTPNRRSFVRIHDHGAYATFPGGASKIRDFSVGGAMLEDQDPLHVGSSIRMELHISGEVLYCEGVIKRSDSGSGMAVQFLRLPLPTRERLGRCVDRAVAMESREKVWMRL